MVAGDFLEVYTKPGNRHRALQTHLTEHSNGSREGFSQCLVGSTWSDREMRSNFNENGCRFISDDFAVICDTPHQNLALLKKKGKKWR